jgi:hypothetical protein
MGETTKYRTGIGAAIAHRAGLCRGSEPYALAEDLGVSRTIGDGVAEPILAMKWPSAFIGVRPAALLRVVLAVDGLCRVPTTGIR